MIDKPLHRFRNTVYIYGEEVGLTSCHRPGDCERCSQYDETLSHMCTPKQIWHDHERKLKGLL